MMFDSIQISVLECSQQNSCQRSDFDFVKSQNGSGVSQPLKLSLETLKLIQVDTNACLKLKLHKIFQVFLETFFLQTL